jgi:hypothetical protein
VPAPVDNKPIGTCGTDFASHPFASLPVDQDCNGIADSWEDANSPETDAQGNVVHDASGNTLHLPIDWDQEPGYDGTTVGDGYSVHDEYRGFHYIDDYSVNPSNPTGTVLWTWTDPVKIQDVFFWDAGTPDLNNGVDPCTSPANSKLGTNCFTAALRTLLAQETVNLQGFQSTPFMTFRRVNPSQANALSLQSTPPTTDPSMGVGGVNRNSATRLAAPAGSILGLGGFALVYGSVPANFNQNAIAKCDANPPSLGEYGNSGVSPHSFQNDGGSFINIALPQIVACGYAARSTAQDATGYPQPTFLAQVVAHETGHRLGLYHLYRSLSFQGSVNGLAQNPFAQLTAQGFQVDSNNSGWIYVRYAMTGLFMLNAATNSTTSALQSLDRLGLPICGSVSDFFYAPGVRPRRSGDVWLGSGCRPTPIPTVVQQLSAAPPCYLRYATQARLDLTTLPYALMMSVSAVGTPRGRAIPDAGMNLMGWATPVFNVPQYGTVYRFDDSCELPHLRLTPLGN